VERARVEVVLMPMSAQELLCDALRVVKVAQLNFVSVLEHTATLSRHTLAVVFHKHFHITTYGLPLTVVT
jgi:hypothetical protein